MTADTELQGQITLLSDQGEVRSAFAVVEVQGILLPLIVPAACIRLHADGSDLETRAPAVPAERHEALKTSAM